MKIFGGAGLDPLAPFGAASGARFASWPMAGGGHPDVRGVAHRLCAGAEPSSRSAGSIPRRAWRRRTSATPTAIIAICGALIDNEKTAKADRIKALIARAGAYERQRHDRPRHRRLRRALRLDPDARRYLQHARRTLAQEGRPAARAGRFRRGDQAQPGSCRRPRPITRRWRRSWSGIGAQMAVAGKPSFNCATAQPRGGEGDLRQSGTGRSRPRDRRA